MAFDPASGSVLLHSRLSTRKGSNNLYQGASHHKTHQKIQYFTDKKVTATFTIIHLINIFPHFL